MGEVFEVGCTKVMQRLVCMDHEYDGVCVGILYVRSGTR